MTFSATDNTGESSVNESVLVRIDTVAPSAPTAPTLTAESDTGSSASDQITNDRTPTFTGTAEAGSTVTLYSSGTLVGTAVATGGVYSITSSTLSAGTRTMTVRATDLAGNLGSSSASTSISIDYTAPEEPEYPRLASASDSGRSSSDRITNDTTPTFSGDGSSGTVGVTLYAGGTAVGNSTASSSSYTVTSSPLTDGVHSMTARVSDTAGNLSEASSVRTVTIDTVSLAPSAPVLAASSDTGSSTSDGITNDTTPTFTGTNESLAIVALYDVADQVGTRTTTNATYSVTSSAMASGEHTVTTTATDVAGNLSPASESTTITIDTTAPTAPSAPVLTADSDTGTSSTDRITNDRTPTFTGTAEADTNVTLFDSGNTTGDSVTATDGSYTATTSTLSTGTRTITARTDPDVAGNVGISPGTTVTIDYTAPSAPEYPTPTSASDSGRSSSDRVTNDTTPTFSGDSTTGAIGVTLYDGSTEVGGNTASSWSYTVTSSELADGVHSMTARVSDTAGNLSSASSIRTVTIDTVTPEAPAAPVLAASSDTGSSSTDGITNDTTPTFTGTNESLAIVALHDVADQVGTSTTTGSTYSVTSSAMSNGDHTVTTTATDVAGNLGPASESTTITIDTTAPTAPSAPVLTAESDSGVSSGDRITNVTTPTLTGTAEAGTNVTLVNGGTATGASVTVTDGSYTATTDTLTSGNRTLTARTDPDVAGNVGISPGTTVTIDITAPTVTINEASGQDDPADTSPIEFRVLFNGTVYGFTSSDITLTGTATPTAASVTGSGTTYYVDVTGMNRAGTVIATVAAGQAQDAAGNSNVASTSSDNTVTYNDNIAPTVSITSFTATAGQSATISGAAGIAPGDNATVTVVLCTQSSSTCSTGNTKATLTANVNPMTGVWTVTSGTLGTTPSLYARAISSDLSGNTRKTSAEGPISIS